MTDPTTMPGLSIGRLAREAGVGVETIRFYERRGLIADPPRKHRSGYRDYPQEAVRRLRFIRRAKGLGFSLGEIEELLALRVRPAVPCEQVRDQIASKLADVEQRIRELQRMGQALSEFYVLCESSNSQGPCPILDLLEEEVEAHEHG